MEDKHRQNQKGRQQIQIGFGAEAGVARGVFRPPAAGASRAYLPQPLSAGLVEEIHEPHTKRQARLAAGPDGLRPVQQSPDLGPCQSEAKLQILSLGLRGLDFRMQVGPLAPGFGADAGQHGPLMVEIQRQREAADSYTRLS